MAPTVIAQGIQLEVAITIEHTAENETALLSEAHLPRGPGLDPRFNLPSEEKNIYISEGSALLKFLMDGRVDDTTINLSSLGFYHGEKNDKISNAKNI